jgi:hypothetical protein
VSNPGVFKEVWTYVRSHWLSAVLVVPMAIVVTTIHELAHAGAAWLYGAEIGHISVIPSPGHWGHMSYTLPEPNPAAVGWIALAPYGVGAAIGVLGAWVSTSRQWTPRGAQLIFVWGVVVPLLEPAYAMLQWLHGAPNDLYSALGPVGLAGALFTAVYGAFVVWTAWWVQQGCYGERALSLRAFGLLSAATAVVLFLLG